MKVAVLNISISEYVCFWEEFYKTAKKNFMTDCEKEFFVFTDSDYIYGLKNEDVHKYYQEDMGWPFNTMKRFQMFRRILADLEEFDYVFFINGNAVFKHPLTSKIIIKDVITVEHPGFHFAKSSSAPFERRSDSRAKVEYGQERKYVQGAFYGAKYSAFCQMVEELDDLTEADLKENIVAVWHDESFLNHYVAVHDNIQILGWQYLKYEEYVMPYKPIIELRNKRKYLSMDNGRFQNRNNRFNMLILFLRNIKWGICIALHIYKKCTIEDGMGNYIDFDIN